MLVKDRLLVAGLLSFSTATQACSPCLNGQQMRTRQDELLARNLSDSEPAMRAAARAAGATLLSLRPQTLYGPELIPTEHEGLFRLFDSQRGERLAIVIRSPSWTYARLARTGDTFFVLEPEATAHETDHVEACECDRMPHPSVDIWNVFLVEPSASATVKRICVPVLEGVLKVDCKLFAV